MQSPTVFQSAETLVRLGHEQRVRLVMPKLGVPVEPSRVESVEPWWQSARDARVEERVAGTLRG